MENDEEIQLNTEHKSNKKKKVFICIGILIVLIAIIATVLIIYFKSKNSIEPSNVVVANKEFHKIEISWDYSEKIENYEVIISSKEFTRDDIANKLKNNQISEEYKRLKVQGGTKVEVEDLLSNTDYYIVVVGYNERNGKITYSNPSQVIKTHTDPLKVGKIMDLSVKEVTDKSIELQWTPWTTNEKNLDETDIEIMYSIYSLNNENEETNLVMSNISESNASILDLTPLTKYCYKIVVQAKVDGTVISGEESEPLEVKTKSESVPNVQAKSGGTSSITVSWSKYDNVENVTYDIYGSNNQNGDFELLKEGISELTYTESNLSENKTRYYYVIAKLTINDEIYESVVSNTVSATTDKKKQPVTKPSSSKPTTSSSGSTSSQSSSSSSSGLSKSEKNAQARVVARQIAASITGSTDLERVTKAARIVSGYYYSGVHKESGPDYNTPYGVFIKGESSCAGCTRALGMVLEEMGYSWKHVNENQWTHQWVTVNMDGQVGWADGQIGMAGYGAYPFM